MKSSILATILAGVLSLFGATLPTSSPPPYVPVPPPFALTAAAASAGSTQQSTHHAITYTVQAKDTLSGIAQMFSVPMRDILAANGLSQGAILHPGEALTIPDPQTASATSAHQSAALANAPAPSASSAVVTPSPRPVSTSSFVTQDQFNAGLASLNNSLQELVFQNSSAPVVSGAGAPLSVEAFAPSQRINNLTNITVSGVTGLTAGDIPALNYLPLSGGSLSGSLSLTNASSSLLSVFNKAYFGGTATTTIDSAGNVAVAGTLNVTGNTTLANATTTNLFSTTASSTNLFAQTASLGSLSAKSLSLNAPLAAANGGTGWSAIAAGFLPFGNGGSALATSSSLYWDNTNGRLGIGTTSPTAILTLDSSSPTGTIMRVSNSSLGGHIYDWLSTGSGNTGGAGRLDLYDFTAGAPRLSIAANGNIGIGTTSPFSMLSVAGNGYFNGSINVGDASTTRSNLGLAYAWNTDIANIATEKELSQVIVAWGDSLTSGTYPSELSMLSGYAVYDGGVGGDTSTQIETRMLAATDKYSFPTIIWAGRNDILQSVAPSVTEANIASMVAALTSAGNTNYVILSITNDLDEPSGSSGYNAVIALNSYLATTYGSHYLDLRSFLVHSALADAGLTPTSQDLTDIANDVPPTQLHADSVHFNSTGYNEIAKYINTHINLLQPPSQAPVLSTSLVTTQGLRNLLASSIVSFAGSIDVGNGGYKQNGTTILTASSTNANTLVGQDAGKSLLSTALNNTALGFHALYTATSSNYNTAVGVQALYSNTYGIYNEAFGNNALLSNTTGSENSAFGIQALNTNTTGSYNHAFGFQALYYNTTGSYNGALGGGALFSNTTGSNNIAFGLNALRNNVSATSSTAVGYRAGQGTANYNNQGGVYLGYQSGMNASTGSDFNTLIGYQAGYGITTGARNVLLGQSTISASYGQVTTGSNNIAIGNDVALASSTLSNQLNIGNLIYGTGLSGTGSNVSPGDIGIGTTTPWAALSVTGPDTSATTPAFSVANSSNTTLFNIFDNGNVGIGTTSPSTQLFVSGGDIRQVAYGNPVQIGAYNPSTGHGEHVYVSGKYAYLAALAGDLDIIDVSNPASPSLVSTFATANNAYSIFVSGNYAYVGNTGGFQIIDVSNPASPSLVSTITNGHKARDIYVSGKYMYAAADDVPLEIFDISNPAAPVLVGTNNSGGAGYSVYVSGKYAYLADFSLGLKIIDISNPTAPVVVGSNPAGDYSGTLSDGIYVSGRYAYLTNFGGFFVVDVSNPTAPSIVATSTINGVYDAYASGKYAYLAAGSSDLQVMDISNPAAPMLVGSDNYGAGNNATGIFVSGKYAYVADQNSGLHIIDINGTEVPGLNAGNIQTNDLNTTENVNVGGDIYAQGGLNVGISGIFSRGGIASYVASTTAANPISGTFMGGNVGIGTTTPYSRLTIWGPDSAASTSAFLVSNNASTTEFSVLDNGNATLAGNLIQNSDQRLKTNIQSLDASSSLAAIEALDPVTFNWADPAKGITPQLGFIAQQVLPIFPNLISTTSATNVTPDGTLSLNYIGFIAPIVKSIQQLAQEIADFADSFTTKELTFTRATGVEIDAKTLCLQKSDGTNVCVTGDQLAAALGGSTSGGAASPAAAPDTTPPIISINGNNPAHVNVGDAYSDLGATITGPQADLNLGITTFLNGALTSNIVIDTSAAATDTIDYVVTDTAGLVATSTRTVIVSTPAASNAPSTTASSTAATSSPSI